jgi:hypothetical protein
MAVKKKKITRQEGYQYCQTLTIIKQVVDILILEVNILSMEITVNTIYGTFIVPRERADQLISWLQVNAIKQGQQPIGEVQQGNYTGRQLINE